MKKFVDTENAGTRPTGNYAQVISQISKDGVCPFCSDNLAKYHKLPIQEKTYWTVTDNMYAYKPSKVHRLLIHREHISHISEISEDAWAELRGIIREETLRLKATGGTLIIRFGDTKYTGASVTHLHAHIIQSDPDSGDYDKSRGLVMRIG